MCEKAVENEPGTLIFVPDHLKTQRMCERAVEKYTRAIESVPDRLKTQRMCERAVEKEPGALEDIPDHLKTREMCDRAVRDHFFSLQYVPDWFVTQQQIKIWHDDSEYHDDDKFFEWYDGYKKRKAQKAKTKDELMPIAWHPSRWWDCLASIKMVGLVCPRRREKRDRKIVDINMGFFVSCERIFSVHKT